MGIIFFWNIGIALYNKLHVFKVISYTHQLCKLFFLNRNNLMMLQVEIILNQSVTNIFMSPKLFQIIIKGHILNILNSKSLTYLSPIMTPTMVNGLYYSPDKQPPPSVTTLTLSSRYFKGRIIITPQPQCLLCGRYKFTEINSYNISHCRWWISRWEFSENTYCQYTGSTYQ